MLKITFYFFPPAFLIPWQCIFANFMDSLKNHFDPNNIMNPGGTLGLDITDDEKRFVR